MYVGQTKGKLRFWISNHKTINYNKKYRIVPFLHQFLGLEQVSLMHSGDLPKRMFWCSRKKLQSIFGVPCP